MHFMYVFNLDKALLLVYYNLKKLYSVTAETYPMDL